MSLWGMNDGTTATGKTTVTNGNAAIAGGSPAANYVSTDGIEVGDTLILPDSKLYRVTVATSNTALTMDRVYEGGTASNQDITITQIPRNIKITKDDGTGHTLATLGIFGFSGAESMAGGDDVVAIANKKNTYSGPGQDLAEGGGGYSPAPTVTVANPTTRAFNAASASVVVAATDAIVLSDPPATGTKLGYMNFPGGSLAADGTTFATTGTTSGAVMSGGIANATVYFARQANTTAIHLYTTFANATANNGIGKPSTGLISIGAVSGTAGNHCLVGQKAAATAVLSGGRVDSYTITSSGSDYTSAPTVTIAAGQNNAFNAASAVAANGEITISSHTFVVGDRVQYNRNGTTAITELTDLAYYYVMEIASNKLYLAATKGGTKMTLTDGPSANQWLIGETATATATLGVGDAGSGNNLGRQRDMMGAHLGWVKRTVGTGGRAGRVHYETLVAASSISGDGEDLATPDE